MYSRVSSMLRGSGRMIQRAATTTGSLPLSKSLLGTLLKRVSVSRRKVASFLAGTRNQSGHLTEFCRKCSLCFRSTAVSWSGNPAFSIKEIPRDSCSSTRLGTHRYSGDDSQSSRGTQANTYSDRTRSQGASSDTGEGSLDHRRGPKMQPTFSGRARGRQVLHLAFACGSSIGSGDLHDIRHAKPPQLANLSCASILVREPPAGELVVFPTRRVGKNRNARRDAALHEVRRFERARAAGSKRYDDDVGGRDWLPGNHGPPCR